MWRIIVPLAALAAKPSKPWMPWKGTKVPTPAAAAQALLPVATLLAEADNQTITADVAGEEVIFDGQGNRQIIRRFATTFTIDGTEYTVRGHEPVSAAGETHPVYMHSGGGGDKYSDTCAEMRFTSEMAHRGFVAGIAETPEDVSMRCASTDSMLGDTKTSLEYVARKMYSWTGPGDETSSGALAALCRRPTSDCAKGIAIHGLSLGGMMAETSAHFARGVTAVLAWSAGTYLPGGSSCCGYFSGNRTCCPNLTKVDSGAYHAYITNPPSIMIVGDREYVRPASTQLIGGHPLECVFDNATTPYLPRTRRRLILTAHDSWYGDCICPDPDDSDPHYAEHWNRSLDLCSCSSNYTYGALPQAKLASGYDCGVSRNCIHPLDGSGYYVATRDEVGGNETNRYQAHNFHVLSGENDNLNYALQDSYDMNPSFLRTQQPWGLTESFDWLADTARQPLEPDPQSIIHLPEPRLQPPTRPTSQNTGQLPKPDVELPTSWQLGP